MSPFLAKNILESPRVLVGWEPILWTPQERSLRSQAEGRSLPESAQVGVSVGSWGSFFEGPFDDFWHDRV